MGISQYIVAILGVTTPITNNASAIAQFCFICIYIFFFASTFGPGTHLSSSNIYLSQLTHSRRLGCHG